MKTEKEQAELDALDDELRFATSFARQLIGSSWVEFVPEPTREQALEKMLADIRQLREKIAAQRTRVMRAESLKRIYELN